MARTSITVFDSNLSGVNTTTYDAADAANGMQFPNDGETVLHVKNGDTAGKTVTVLSVPCSHGRTDDRAVSVPAGEERMIGPFNPDLFNQSGGNVYVDFDSDTSVTVACLKL